MGASVLVAPRDGKVVVEMQLAAGMYADREANLSAMASMLAIEVSQLLVECMWLLLLLLWLL